jgi:hypothetical protein
MHIGMKLKKNFKIEKWDVKAEDKKLQKGGGNQKFFTTLI